MLKSFDRYLFRLILTPLLATLTIAAMLLLLDKMLKLFNFVINEGGPVRVVWQMLGNLIPQYLTLGIPIGVFLGILLAFRRLATASELDALISSGVSYLRLLRVPMLLAVLFAVVNFAIVGFLQPKTRYAYENLRYELQSGALGASIKVGEFVKFGKRLTMKIDRSTNEGRSLVGIFARMRTKNGTDLTVSAERGEFLASADPDKILFRFMDGMLIQHGPASDVPRVLSFKVHDLPINLPKIDDFRKRGGMELELTIPELWKISRDASTGAKFRRQTEANLYRRLVQSIVMLVLPFLALAYAVPPKRSPSAVGVFAGIILLVVYNKISEAMERAGVSGSVPPWLLQLVPFVIFAAICLWSFHILSNRVGGQPLAYVQRIGESVNKGLRQIFEPLLRMLGVAPVLKTS
jgi:lipopolysaccharide export system permease protein